MSKSINKIRERNLDESLIKRLFFKDEKITYDNLDRDVVTAIKSGTNAKTAYDDSELRKRITNLETSKISIIDAERNYISKSNDLVTEENLDSAIDAKINAFRKEIEKALSKKVNLENRVIDESMLTEELKYKVNARYNNLYNVNSSSGATDLSNLKFEIGKIDEKIENLTNSVNRNTLKKGDLISEEQLDRELQGKINKAVLTSGNLRIADFNNTDRELLTKAINLDITEITDKVLKIEEITSTRRSRDYFLSSTSTNGPTWRKLINTRTLAIKDKDVYDGLHEAILANPNKETITTDRITVNLANYDAIVPITENAIDTNTYLIRLNTDNSATPVLTDAESEPESDWEDSSVAVLDMYAGSIVTNDINNELYYIADDGSVVLLVAGARNVGKITYDEIAFQIPPQGSYQMDLENVLSRVHQVLVLDNEEDSRTYNKFINAEGVVTVAYENSAATFYNDTNKKISVKVMYA